MRVVCHACRDSFEAPSGALSAQCPSCRARVTLTAMETRPAIGLVPAQSDAPPPESLLGRVLGGYTLRAVLGGGGMGVVYEAERTPDATIPGPAIAAVKVLSPAFSADPEFVERFRREADALIALRHPNLIEVYAKGEWSPEPGARPSYFFVMERFFGDDLRALLARGPVAPATVAAIVRGAAAGLAHAHAAGIVHRDVKPANILVSGDPAKDGTVKVVDFGVAHLAAGAYTLTSLTRSHLVLGTINYMSPEQRVDASEIDARADVYALGVVAYELLTGRLPIGVFEPPSELVPRLSRAVDRAVLAALRRDPAQRPAGVTELASLLTGALGPRRRRTALALTAAGVTALGLGALISAQLESALRAPEGKGTVATKVEPKAAIDANAPAQQASSPTTPEPAALDDAGRARLARAAEPIATATKLALERLTPRVRATKAPGGKSAGDDAPPKPAVVEKPSPKKKQARLQKELTLPEALEKK